MPYVSIVSNVDTIDFTSSVRHMLKVLSGGCDVVDSITFKEKRINDFDFQYITHFHCLRQLVSFPTFRINIRLYEGVYTVWLHETQETITFQHVTDNFCTTDFLIILNMILKRGTYLVPACHPQVAVLPKLSTSSELAIGPLQKELNSLKLSENS